MTPWVLRLILLNIGAFMLSGFGADQSITTMFGLYPLASLQQPWTYVTYMFLHGSWSHVLFNMLGLYFFGPRLEARLGGARFIALYLVSGVSGGLLSLVFAPAVITIGASGAVLGVQLGYARYWPRDLIYIWGILPLEARWFVLLFTAIDLFGGVTGTMSGIAHFAHLGGFLGAFLYLKVLDARAPIHRWQQRASVPSPRVETVQMALDRWARIRREELHEVNRDELDRILTKLKAEGAGGLTDGDREFLDRFSARA